MLVRPGKIPGLVVIEPTVRGDSRGYFVETYHRERYREAGIGEPFAQDNLSHSTGGTVRGLHLQHPHGQGKLVSAVRGRVWDVAVDVRVGSPTFGQWEAYELDEVSQRQVYVPPGCAHGFLVQSEVALFMYKCTDTYHPETEFGVAFDDPNIAIAWPGEISTVSDRDRQLPRLDDIPKDRLPRFAGDQR
jgi:dTDP-4-dehydrorhamnose 3,5-epimerase